MSDNTIQSCSSTNNESIGQSLASALADLAVATPSKISTELGGSMEDLVSPSRSDNWESQGVFVKRRKRGFSQENTPFQSPEITRQPEPKLDTLPSLQLDTTSAPIIVDLSEQLAQCTSEPVSGSSAHDFAGEGCVQLPGTLAGFASAAEFVFSGEDAPHKVWGDCCDESSPCFGRMSPVSSSTSWAELARHHRPQDRQRLVAPTPMYVHTTVPHSREPTAAVFVGSLKHYMDEKWVLRFFKPHGAAHVLGSGNGFAVLELPESLAPKFIESFNGKRVDGKKLTVRPSNKPAPASPPGRS